MDTDQVQVVGPIQFSAADGYRMGTHDVDVDLRNNTMTSRGASNTSRSTRRRVNS